MLDLLNRITINPKQCGGRPCIRGMRIRVTDVLDLFASGLTAKKFSKKCPISKWKIYKPLCNTRRGKLTIRYFPLPHDDLD